MTDTKAGVLYVIAGLMWVGAALAMLNYGLDLLMAFNGVGYLVPTGGIIAGLIAIVLGVCGVTVLVRREP